MKNAPLSHEALVSACYLAKPDRYTVIWSLLPHVDKLIPTQSQENFVTLFNFMQDLGPVLTSDPTVQKQRLACLLWGSVWAPFPVLRQLKLKHVT